MLEKYDVVSIPVAILWEEPRQRTESFATEIMEAGGSERNWDAHWDASLNDETRIGKRTLQRTRGENSSRRHDGDESSYLYDGTFRYARYVHTVCVLHIDTHRTRRERDVVHDLTS